MSRLQSYILVLINMIVAHFYWLKLWINGDATKRYYRMWIKSLLRTQTAFDLEKPWLVFPAIDWLDSLDLEGLSVFEWGSGGSTLYFLDKGAHVTSVEHAIDWAENVKIQVEHLNYTNFQQIVAPVHAVEQDGNIDYSAAISAFPDKSFDIILIDGIDRINCFHQAVSKLNTNGYLIFDNFEGYPNFSVSEDNWRAQHYWGFSIRNPKVVSTAVFSHRHTVS